MSHRNNINYIDNDISDDENDEHSLTEEETNYLIEEHEYIDGFNLLNIIKDFRENSNPLILDKLDPVKFLLFLDKLKGPR